MDPQASLRRSRRKRVGIAKANEGLGPGRGFTGEILSCELGEGVESEEGEKGEEVREEGAEESGGCRSSVGLSGGGRCGGGGGGGGPVVENFEVATVAKPGFEGGLGNAESQGIGREHHRRPLRDSQNDNFTRDFVPFLAHTRNL